MTISIPSVESKGFSAKVREFALVALGLTGNPLDAFLTRRDLKEAGLIDVRMGGARIGGAAAGAGGVGATPVRPIIEPAVDLTPPPPPGGFIATAGITQILFETAAPVYRQGHGHARTKVYAAAWDGVSPLPTFADAVLYTDFPGNVGVSPFDPASTLRLWATWTSVDGAQSEPAGGINGIMATTGLLEDQHIANLTVGKLLAGSLDIGQYIQSADYVAGTTGWRIQTLAGGGAYMEINGGATIGGLVVGADNIRSSNYVAGTTGYRFKSDGTGQLGGFVVATDHIRSQNWVLNTSGWKITYDGDFLGPGFTISGGSATFAGALSAATGTFSGSLSAATGTFAGALSAATGTFSGTLTAFAVNAVDSINIAGNAVTIPVSTAASAPIDLLDMTEQTLATLPTFTSKGGQVVISFGAAIGNEPDAGIVADLRVRRNGVSIYVVSVHIAVGTSTLILPPVVDVPGAGVATTYTITITVTNTGGATTGDLVDRAAYSLETIR